MDSPLDLNALHRLPEHRDRETRKSLFWLHGTQHLPRDWRLVNVCDQGADMFEFLKLKFKAGGGL